MECTKTKFIDEKSAEFYINKLKATSAREKKPIRAYLCMKCQTWHLTSKPEKENGDDVIIKALVEKYDAIIKEKDVTIEALRLKLKLRGQEIYKLYNKIGELKNNIIN